MFVLKHSLLVAVFVYLGQLAANWRIPTAGFLYTSHYSMLSLRKDKTEEDDGNYRSSYCGESVDGLGCI